jgi:GNAT superfamily N-acetyltransferase
MNCAYDVIKTDISAIKEYADHLKALSDEDKVSRFGMRLADHAIDDVMLAMAYNPEKHKLWKATLLGETIGWGHLANDHDNNWELAVSVDGEYQGVGVGNTLITEMLFWAKTHNVDEIYMHCIESNKIIQHLAHKHNLRTRDRGAGERTAALQLPDPSLNEMNSQWVKEYFELIGELNSLQKKLSKHMTTPWRN